MTWQLIFCRLYSHFCFALFFCIFFCPSSLSPYSIVKHHLLHQATRSVDCKRSRHNMLWADFGVPKQTQTKQNSHWLCITQKSLPNSSPSTGTIELLKKNRRQKMNSPTLSFSPSPSLYLPLYPSIFPALSLLLSMFWIPFTFSLLHPFYVQIKKQRKKLDTNPIVFFLDHFNLSINNYKNNLYFSVPHNRCVLFLFFHFLFVLNFHCIRKIYFLCVCVCTLHT